jgi:hypothetical protein
MNPANVREFYTSFGKFMHMFSAMEEGLNDALGLLVEANTDSQKQVSWEIIQALTGHMGISVVVENIKMGRAKLKALRSLVTKP